MLAPRLQRRLGLSRGDLAPSDVDALWQLCMLEAGLLHRTDCSCSLFTTEEAQLMEYLEDVSADGFGVSTRPAAHVT